MQKNRFHHSRPRSGEPVIVSPADGRVLPLCDVEDEVFSTGILGKGVAILPDGGEIYAPVDGVVATVAETKHAITLCADSGAQVLIHCGIDTVSLRGEGFELFVAEGERITPGKLLLKFNPNRIREAGFALTTPIVVVNDEEFVLSITASARVVRGEALIRLMKK